MEPKFKQLIIRFGEHRVKFNEPLKFHTISQSDAQAEAFFIATNIQELMEVIKAALQLQISYQVIGAGTRVSFSDQIVPGLVIKNRTSGLKISGVKGKVGVSGIGVSEALIEVDSGVSLNKLNHFLQFQNLPSQVFRSPGEATLGGSLSEENQIHPLVYTVTVLDKSEVREIEPSQLKPGLIILSVVLKIRA